MRVVFFGHGFIVKSILSECKNKSNLAVFSRKLIKSEYETYYFDVLNSKNLEIQLNKDDIVIYSIALKTPGSNYSNEELKIEISALESCLEIFKISKVSRVILISSASVYGFSDSVITEDSQYNPISTYGILKVNMEKVFLKIMSKTSIPHNIFSSRVSLVTLDNVTRLRPSLIFSSK